MKKLALLVFPLLVVACSTPPMQRGSFSLVSTANIDNAVSVLSDMPIEGKACFDWIKAQTFRDDGVFQAAVVDALSHFEGANILIESEFVDTGSCIEVKGLPGKL